jgi:Tfp pilus assembly protein PilV
MITMFLITFIVQGLAMVSLYAQRSGIHARRLTSANIIAEQALEQYRNTDYDNLALANGAQACYDVHMASVACGGSSAFFTKTTTITADTPLANVSLVDVTVTWEEAWSWEGIASGGTQQARVVSYLSLY